MAVPLEIYSRRNWFHHLGDIYEEQFVRRTHPHVMNWPLVENDSICYSIMFSYFMFVKYLGPAIMKNRKPLDLRWLMVPYNIFLVIANFYIFFEYAKLRWSGGFKMQCNATYTTSDSKMDSKMYRFAEITWYFYITKYIELIDTIFFVLRKKDRQLSRLHIIHHTTVPLMILGLLRSEPDSSNTFFPVANAFVHCVMYTYYGISALGEDVTIHLKFKKYVTMTQLIQFTLVIYYFFSRPFYGCQWSWLHGGGSLLIAGFFFILFCNFYWHEYCRRIENTVEQNEEKEPHSEGYENSCERNGFKKRTPYKRIL